jgi:cupin 2 domain-containing protein
VKAAANLFSLPQELPTEELTEILLQKDGIRVERILSTGQASPPGFWYEQAEDEWVAVLQGEASLQWEDGRVMEMKSGDWLLIPAHKRHRVERTSVTPPCVWLAIFSPSF